MDYTLETWETDTMVQSIERPNMFLVRMFFPTERYFTTSQIEFDVVEGGKRLAPFVSPNSQGRPMKGRGFATKYLKPAYIKPTRVVVPGEAFTRRAGEPYGGNLSLGERITRAVAEEILEHRDMIDNRLEWMAAKILTTGSVVISGDDYPSTTVEFGHSSALRTTLGGSVEWDDANGDPIADIERIALQVQEKSFGAMANTVVMDGKSWALFRAKMATNPLFNTQLRLGNATIDSGPRNDREGTLVGNLSGRFNIWVYDGAYEDDNGVTQKFLPDYNVIIGNPPAIEGIQYYGAIQDLEHFMPVKHYVKTWLNKNPSGMNVLSQSAPVLAPKRPNAFARVIVKTP